MKIKKYLDFDQSIQNEAQMAVYPQPNVDQAVASLLARVEPLVSKAEWIEFQQLIAEFVDSKSADFAVQKIQQLAQDPHSSYLYDYWLRKWAVDRRAQQPYANVPVIFDHPHITNKSMLEKAAYLAQSLTKVYLEFREREHGVYSVGRREYSEDQMYGLLAASQDIGVGYDRLYINEDLARHVLIAHQNRFYALTVADSAGNSYSYGTILAGITAIYQQEREPLKVNANLATVAVDRDAGAQILAEIVTDKANQQSYQIIQNAIGLINLDSVHPTDLIDELNHTMHDGDYLNRWAGKGIQFTINQAGTISFVFNHTMSDGGTYAYLTHLMVEKMLDMEETSAQETVEYVAVDFKLTEAQQATLRALYDDYLEQINELQIFYQALPQLTREILRGNGVLSGDGFFHLALQLAQQRVYGAIRNTYAPVDVRHFFKGRTEANRPVTALSVEFIGDFVQGKATKDDLLAVLDLHFQNTRQAQAGQGAERFWMVVQEILQDAGKALPAFMKHVAYQTLTTDFITTTSFGTPETLTSYFPPEHADGVAIFYKVMGATDVPSLSTLSHIIVTVGPSQADQAEDFVAAIDQAVTDLIRFISDSAEPELVTAGDDANNRQS